jgi:hypothetical protein
MNGRATMWPTGFRQHLTAVGDERYHRRMPETSAGPTKAAHESDHKASEPFAHWWSSPRVTTFLTLALATIAVAVAVAAWFRAAHGGPSFNADQVSQAKTNVCAAYVTVRQGVVENTHMRDPDPNVLTGKLAVATSARLALVGGGAYLSDRLAAQPATPADLAKAVNSMSATIEQLGVNYLAGADSTAQDPLRKNLDGQITQINGLCK